MKTSRIALTVWLTLAIGVFATICSASLLASVGQSEESPIPPADPSEDVGEVFLLSLGGKIYDNLWIMMEESEPTSDNREFPARVSKELGTWRCVSCHGWDYRGSNGERGKHGISHEFTDLTRWAGEDISAIQKEIRDPPHIYDSNQLNDAAVELLSVFISAGQYPKDQILDAKGMSLGDPANGQAVFEGACMNCHDTDGRAYLRGEIGDKSSIGWIARNRPEQAIHKILNGVPSTYMLAMRFLSFEATADLMAYLQTLDPDASR